MVGDLYFQALFFLNFLSFLLHVGKEMSFTQDTVTMFINTFKGMSLNIYIYTHIHSWLGFAHSLNLFLFRSRSHC